MQEPAVLGRPVCVLCTSVGTEALHGFEPDLRKRAPQWQIVGTDVNPFAAGLYRCNVAYTVPDRHHSSFLDTLVSICDQHAVDLVLPLSTLDQAFFSRSETRAALGQRPIVVSSAEAVRRASSKIAAYEGLASIADWLPTYRVVHSAEQAIEALDAIIAVHGAAVLKSDTSTGDAGKICFGCPSDESEPMAGRQWLDWIAARQALYAEESKAKILPQLAALYSLESDWPRLAVAYLPGAEYSVDVLSDAGRPLGGVVQLRRVSNGGRTVATETVRADDVLQAGYRVASELGLSYVNTMRFRRDTAGQPRLLDIHPRVSDTIALTVEAGLNLPLAACCLALGDPMPLSKPEIGVHAMRHAGSVFTRSLAPKPG